MWHSLPDHHDVVDKMWNQCACECAYLECEHHNYGVASQARLCEPPSAAAATAAVVTADARGVDGARSISSTCGGDHR